MQNTALITLLREYDIFPDDPEIRDLFGFLEDEYQQVIDQITAQQKDIIDLLNSSNLEARSAAYAITSIDKSKADLLMPTLIEGLKNETYWHYAADTCLILGPLAAPVVSTLIEILETAAAQDWRIPGGTFLRRYRRGVFGFVGVGRKVVQRLMNPLGIVKRLDVPEDAQPRFLQVSKPLVIRPLVFQRPEESLHHRVVVATAATTHRTRDAQQSSSVC